MSIEENGVGAVRSARGVGTGAIRRALVGLVAGAVLAVPSPATGAGTDDPSFDGLSQATAAASCWEAKAVDPQAPDGVYWLITPQLVAPQQFYCDMTTDGGGWVLVGRGRTGWLTGGDGLGSAAAVRQPITGTTAFGAKQLPSATIDALLGGGRVDDLPDGIRVRRAQAQDGSRWQEIRFQYRSRDRWTWAFAAGHPLRSYSIGDDTSSTEATSRSFKTGWSNDTTTVWTYKSASNGYVAGFNYGQSVRGADSSTSYLFSLNSDGSYATPFAQVWLRPRLRTADLVYPDVGDTGTAERVNRALASSYALPGAWGVTGLGAGGTSETATEVAAFAQIGGVIFVGGNFTTVQKGATPAAGEQADQAYLAAFDATTGAWIPGFRPTLNNQVKALVALPDGRLGVGGQFTTVNGGPAAGFVALDPSSGEVSGAFGVTVENRTSSGTMTIRTMDLQDGWLYLGGSFTHLRGSGQGTAVYTRNAGRVRLSDSRADGDWNPDLNGTVVSLDVSADSTRVYLAGYFTSSRGVTLKKATAVSAEPGAALVKPLWTPTWSTGTSSSAGYQQAVREVGSRVWLGGSQHSMFGYGRAEFDLQSPTITRSGGDLQAIEANQDVVYGGCHCPEFAYYGTTDYSGTEIGETRVVWSQGESIGFVGAWDAGSGEYVPEFNPQSRSRISMGAWALFQAADETLWAGGTYTSVLTTTGSNQWAGGFVRFGMRDHVAPVAPSNLSGSVSGSTAQLGWAASPTAGTTYEVLRGGRVVATTTGTTAAVPFSTSGDRFFVRATDAAGNRSASTPVAVLRSSLVARGSAWSYHFDNRSAVPADWKDAGFDDSGWPAGPAPLGWGSAVIATDLTANTEATRALASYHRHAVTIDDPAALRDVRVTTWADDGIVVYVNGTEIGRQRMPAGPVGPSTYATATVGTGSAMAAPVEFAVDPALLVAGRNVIAAEVHSGYRGTPDTSMDLSVTYAPEAAQPR